ncbi:MAG: AGE family epimerase/isomerase [Candidatus Hydrogenedentota bacterium]
MKRREFLQVTGAAGALLGTNAAMPRGAHAAAGRRATVYDAEGKIGGRTLDDMIARYRYDLFDDFLPFMHEHIIDHKHGGFMTNANRAGEQVTTNKRSRYEGRGIWVYAHLYRTLAPEKKYIEAARKSVEFIMAAKPEGKDALWPNQLTRTGEPLEDEGMLIAGKRYKSGGEIYDDLFLANGLAEYARATGKERYRQEALDILAKCERLFEQEDYAPTAPLVYMGGMEAPVLPGCRPLGVWMVMIRLATQMLRAGDNKHLQALADRCVESIMKHHYDAKFDLLLEVLNHDMTKPDNAYAQLVYTGHGIETLWMVMDEAVRRKDRGLFDDAARLFKRTLEVAWDDVYQGWYRGCRHVDENIWILDKACWVQEEALIGLMMIIEHTGAQWAKDWFERGYTYVIDNFPLAEHGYPIWDLYPDRWVTFVEDFDRVGHFHHPRHLMLNLEALQRIEERNGKVSDVFA